MMMGTADKQGIPVTTRTRPVAVVLAGLLAAGVVVRASTRTAADDVPLASVAGSAWQADGTPLPGARLRLRNVTAGQIVAAAIADGEGRFAFKRVSAGQYLVELVDENGRVLALGDVFAAEPGETVATFVRLRDRGRWYDGFFRNAAAAVALSAASQGITAIAPVVRPVSAGR
jgi:hypothetical protein